MRVFAFMRSPASVDLRHRQAEVRLRRRSATQHSFTLDHPPLGCHAITDAAAVHFHFLKFHRLKSECVAMHVEAPDSHFRWQRSPARGKITGEFNKQ